MAIEKVETKGTILNGKDVTITSDGKWYKAIDLTKALNSNFIYTATNSLEALGVKGITEIFKTDLNEREYKFINLDKLKSEWVKHEDEIKADKTKARTTYPSIKKAMRLINEATQSNTQIILDLQKHKANRDADKSVNIILEELIKLSQQLDSKETMEKVQILSKENADLHKAIKNLHEQLELSEKKYEEIKAINIKAIADRDRLTEENTQLKIFKSSIQKMLTKE
ncbi:MAG: hypothetical protein ACRDBY_13035 [Cetobacterium sp.]